MFPARALFAAMQEKGYDVSMAIDARGDAFCEDIIAKIVFKTVKFSAKEFPIGIYRSFIIFFKFLNFWLKKRPNLVIGFGGVFTIIPVILSKILGSRIVIYEQNAVLGKANEFLMKFADLRLASFLLGEGWTEVPAPVRSSFVGKRTPYECDGIIKILIIGGSQGAASFSHIIPKALGMLAPEERHSLEIVQQVAYGSIEKLKTIYEHLGVKSTLKGFIHQVAEEMFRSQLVICRAGASTLSELAAAGRPAVLIPYPGAMDNHQLHNAMHYKDKGAAWVLEEENDIERKLWRLLRKILQDRELLKTASFHMMNSSVGHATDRFIELIERV
jgi:UDP-N-acetylglucosamine--N-acetylmuramyl-(pentapeptide) pyrophosphoryl-undecaprenol N-acetylglucosamine transferase